MYDYHYNFAKKKFDADLLFTDTDSPTDEIKSKDVYEEFFKHNNCLISETIQKIQSFLIQPIKFFFGKMKDDSEGKIIDEFVGLKSKLYSMKNIDGKESNATKGVNIATEFNEFKDTFFNSKVLTHKMRRIQGKKHKLEKNEINKISSSCFDDEKSVLDDEIHKLAYFHKGIDSHKW